MTIALPFTPEAWYNSSVGQLIYKYNLGPRTSTVAISTNNWTSSSSSTVDLSGTVSPNSPLNNCFLEESGAIYNIRLYPADDEVCIIERSYDGVIWTTFYYSYSSRLHYVDYCFKIGSTYYIFQVRCLSYIQLYFQTTSSLTLDWSSIEVGSFDSTYSYYGPGTDAVKLYWFYGYFYIFPAYYFPAYVPPGAGKAIHQSADGITWTVVTANFTPLVNSGDRVKTVFAYNGKFYATIYNPSVGFLKTYNSSDLITWTYMPSLTERYLVISNNSFSAYQYTTDVCFIAGAEVLHLPLSALGAPAPTSIVL